ncbi:hypothetical protein F8M41_006258 [Gigaspora margarita]|uniref:BTB domain-containing protein n=1 Tax=Gigaspora margarita TaxID=4874 RepID=A0A8H4AWV6_GIGMA|nr:hypothetical protein F8M41_006258 [Gigaspora margarita]
MEFWAKFFSANSSLATIQEISFRLPSSNSKIFRAHSAILRHRSLYFRKELKNISKDKNPIDFFYCAD